MNIFDYDLDRFAKALNIQGFDLVLLLDTTGTVLAEKSSYDFDRELIAEHVSSISQIAVSLSTVVKGGGLQAVYLEYEQIKIVVGMTKNFVLCGIPSNGTPQVYAKNEIGHALQALV